MYSMLNIITKGIGSELSKPIRISYYEKKRLLDKNKKFQQSSNEIQLFLCDILALSLFNQKVITPLYGAGNFMDGTRSYGVNRVRMGTYHLDEEFHTTSNNITRQFYAIVKKYDLEIEALHVSSINDFVDTWLKGIDR